MLLLQRSHFIHHDSRQSESCPFLPLQATVLLLVGHAVSCIASVLSISVCDLGVTNRLAQNRRGNLRSIGGVLALKSVVAVTEVGLAFRVSNDKRC